MKYLSVCILPGTTTAANANIGHLADVAGHAHWLGAVAIKAFRHKPEAQLGGGTPTTAGRSCSAPPFPCLGLKAGRFSAAVAIGLWAVVKGRKKADQSADAGIEEQEAPVKELQEA